MARVPSTLVERGHLPAEREILRVLWNSPDEHLVRSEIHRRMSQAHQPTLGRVGQLLTELKTAELVVFKMMKAQGSRQAAFYQLSARGLELCRDLGFERWDETLFPISEDEQRTVLTRERLMYRPEEPGRIVALYGYRGGIGRTTAAAYVAKGMAERLEQKSVLVVDLDISAPGLEKFFHPPEGCRGLAGLILDYQRKGTHKRELWLRGAVGSEEYVHRPFPETTNLAFMPNGFGPGSSTLTPTERAEAIALLTAGTTQDGASFLAQFRAALQVRHGKTLVDSQPGRGLSPWIATQALADALVLCLRESDTDASSLGGLRAVLASFLTRHDGARVTFLFQVWKPTNRAELNRWIDRHFVTDLSKASDLPNYEPEVILHDPRLLSLSDDWGSIRTYDSLVARLAGFDASALPLASPSLELLMMVLDPKKSSYWRDLAAGALTNMRLEELARALEFYEADPSVHRDTDELGHKLIDNVLRGHERRVRSILPRRTR